MVKKGSGARGTFVRVKTAKGRKVSSKRWLERQLNDPYVARAKAEGYRSRAAFKLIEMDDKFHLLKPGQLIVDLGAAPGSWSQVAVERLKGKGKVIGIDLLEIPKLAGAEFIQGDFLDDAAFEILKGKVGPSVHMVMSDMAANASGHVDTDHIRIMTLCEAALDYATQILKPGGAFIAKVLKGGTEKELLLRLKKHFSVVKHFKPDSSRAESSEMYVVATGFKGESGQSSEFSSQ